MKDQLMVLLIINIHSDSSAERDFTGVGAVGQVLTSVTDHIVYVKSDLASAFELSFWTSTGLSIA